MDEIVVLDDAVGHIKKYPHRYLKSGTVVSNAVTGSELAASIVEEVLILTGGPLTTFCEGEWWLIASSIDWLGERRDLTPEELFVRIIPFSEAGPNFMRREVLLTAFARDVLIKSAGRRSIIKGDVPTNDDIWRIVDSDEDWRGVIAFRL